MPLPQRASPAKVVQKMIVAAGLAIMPGVIQHTRYAAPAQCFADEINDDIDFMVCVANMKGMNFGRMAAGHYAEHYGLKFTFRAVSGEAEKAFQLGMAVQNFVDGVKYQQVILTGTAHNVESIYRLGTLSYVGEETPKRRQLYGFTGRLVMSFVESTIAED